MIGFIGAMTALTAAFGALALFIKRKIVTNYWGGLFIFLSALYFAAIFTIAHIMRESFK